MAERRSRIERFNDLRNNVTDDGLFNNKGLMKSETPTEDDSFIRKAEKKEESLFFEPEVSEPIQVSTDLADQALENALKKVREYAGKSEDTRMIILNKIRDNTSSSDKKNPINRLKGLNTNVTYEQQNKEELPSDFKTNKDILEFDGQKFMSGLVEKYGLSELKKQRYKNKNILANDINQNNDKQKKDYNQTAPKPEDTKVNKKFVMPWLDKEDKNDKVVTTIQNTEDIEEAEAVRQNLDVLLNNIPFELNEAELNTPFDLEGDTNKEIIQDQGVPSRRSRFVKEKKEVEDINILDEVAKTIKEELKNYMVPNVVIEQPEEKKIKMETSSVVLRDFFAEREAIEAKEQKTKNREYRLVLTIFVLILIGLIGCLVMLMFDLY